MAATKEQQALCEIFGSSEIEKVLEEFAKIVPDPRAFLVERGIFLPPEASVTFEITSSDPTDVPPRPACTRQCWNDGTGRQVCVITCV